jgi:hypothetical protein
MLRPYKYLNELKHDVRPKLMGFASPGAVRASALRLLENRPESDFLFRHAMKDVPGYSPLQQLLMGWNKEGHWGIDRLYMRLKGEAAALERAKRECVRNLHRLTSYLWNGRKGRLKQAAELLLSGAEESGFISVVDKSSKSRRQADHWGGYLVDALVTLGVEDKRIDHFYHYLAETQRDDGGWFPPLVLKASGLEDQEGLASHPLYTVSFARALAAHDEYRSSEGFKKAVDFLLDVCFREDLEYKKFGTKGWYTLAWPTFGFSALEILLLAADAGVDAEDERLDNIIKWLTGEQDKSSIWKATVKRQLYPDEELFLTMTCAGTLKELLDDPLEPS